MPEPRGVEERITWFLNHSPGGVGMCARHSWRSLGGDYGNPPRWGCPNANCVFSKVLKSGRYWRGGTPPRGALVLWHYGLNGHAALSLGDGRIATTDPTGKPGGTGIEPIDYPRKWGARGYIWTDTYNGTQVPIGGDDMGKVSGYRDYTGKRVAPVEVALDGKWQDIDGMTLQGSPFSKPDETQSLYCRLVPTWPEPGEGVAVAPLFVEIRYRRDTGDATAYDENQYAPGSASIPVWVDHDEYGQKGVGGKWQIKAHGGPTRLLITTRYAKLRAFDVDWV